MQVKENTIKGTKCIKMHNWVASLGKEFLHHKEGRRRNGGEKEESIR